MNWWQQIEDYIPFNEQEETDKQVMLRCIETFPDVLTRTNSICHMTVSSFALNDTRTQVLMAHHNIYNSWGWMGGHADGDSNFLQVALRELAEESGVTTAKPLTDSIFSLEVLPVHGHVKNGAYVSPHLHLNVTFMLEASMTAKLTIAESENSNVGWLPITELSHYCEEAHMLPIYEKIIKKLISTT